MTAIPRLTVFTSDEKLSVKEQVEEAVKSMKKEELATLLECIQNGKNLPKR
jgi:predicted house-cleaning noncanonical NTP pyrophosphatase (MazG superfamily)